MNNADEREEIVKDLDEQWRYLNGELPPMDELVGFGEVRAILDEEDCLLTPDCLEDPLFRKFYGLVRQGLLRLNQIAISLVNTGTLPESQHGENNFMPARSVFVANGTTTKSLTLDQLIDRFEECPRRQHLRRATRAEYQLIYRALREHVGGETLICFITREAILGVAETFRHVPSRATLRAPRTPLHQLAAERKRTGLPAPPAKTYNKKVQQISALFRYAVTEQLLCQNPATKLSLPEPPTSGEDKGFTIDQLNAIFSGELFRRFITESGSQFVPNHSLRPCFFWVPLLGLYQGCRSGEILQLKTANVRERSGVVALKVEGVVKNQQSIRWVRAFWRSCSGAALVILLPFALGHFDPQQLKKPHATLFPFYLFVVLGTGGTCYNSATSEFLMHSGLSSPELASTFSLRCSSLRVSF